MTATVDKHRSVVYTIGNHQSLHRPCLKSQCETYRQQHTDYVLCFWFRSMHIDGLFGAALAHLDHAIHARCLTDSIKHLTQFGFF